MRTTHSLETTHNALIYSITAQQKPDLHSYPVLARATYTAIPSPRNKLYAFVAVPPSITLEREGNHPWSPAAAQTHAVTEEGAELKGKQQGNCRWGKRKELMVFSFLFACGFI